MKNLLILLTVVTSTFATKAQNVEIPDANFKANLVQNTAINTDGDTEISVSEAAAFTGELMCNEQAIADLSGVEYFTALTALDCSDNEITELDLSQNPALKELRCARNKISSLQIDKNIALNYLDCSENKLINLNLSNNNSLSYLECNTNELITLNLSNNTALEELHCPVNKLTNLDISNCKALTKLRCQKNSLNALNVLENTKLTMIECDDNQLKTLDVSKNNQLTWLNCNNNQLTALNIANGNNKLLKVMRAKDNAALSCIQVDNVTFSNANWQPKALLFEYNKDTRFSNKCTKK